MKRSGPPQRHARLQARTGLARTPISPGTASLQRQARIAPVSNKRKAENRERKAMADRRYGPERPLCAFPGPPHWADAFHEPLTRARGGSITDEANTVPMCNEHNGRLANLVGAELEWAHRVGLLVHSWDGAA